MGSQLHVIRRLCRGVNSVQYRPIRTGGWHPREYLAAYPNDAYTRVLLVAAYGQLGRVSDAARTYQKANEYFSRGSVMPPWTILQAGIAIPLADHAYAERLRRGLVKAGIPELPFDYDPASKDRLNASEIGSLLFGHTIIYKNPDAVSAASIAFTKEGTPTRISVGSSEAGHPHRGLCRRPGRPQSVLLVAEGWAGRARLSSATAKGARTEE